MRRWLRCVGIVVCVGLSCLIAFGREINESSEAADRLRDISLPEVRFDGATLREVGEFLMTAAERHDLELGVVILDEGAAAATMTAVFRDISALELLQAAEEGFRTSWWLRGKTIFFHPDGGPIVQRSYPLPAAFDQVLRAQAGLRSGSGGALDSRRVLMCLSGLGFEGGRGSSAAWDASTSTLHVSGAPRDLDRIEEVLGHYDHDLPQLIVSVAIETSDGVPVAPGLSVLTTSGVESECERRVPAGDDQIMDAAIKVRPVVSSDGYTVALDLDASFRIPGPAGATVESAGMRVTAWDTKELRIPVGVPGDDPAGSRTCDVVVSVRLIGPDGEPVHEDGFEPSTATGAVTADFNAPVPRR